MNDRLASRIILSGAFVIASALGSHAALSAPMSLQFVPVGDPGNSADPATGSLYGAVNHAFNIGKYDVTAGQYTAFLKSFATGGDPLGLYNPAMAPLLLLPLEAAAAQYQGWQHSGSLWILTTPEGANLPARCSEANFPLLVRLDRGNFDFREAQPHGEDVRFSDSAAHRWPTKSRIGIPVEQRPPFG